MRDTETGTSRSRRLRSVQPLAPQPRREHDAGAPALRQRQTMEQNLRSLQPQEGLGLRRPALPSSPPSPRQEPSPPQLDSSQSQFLPSPTLDPAAVWTPPAPTPSTSIDPLLPKVPTPSGPAPSNATSWSGSLFPNVTQSMSSSFSSSLPSSSSTSVSKSSSSTYSRPWTYTATPSRTTSGSAPSQTTYVPGVIFDLTIAGDSDTQAVYSVPMTFGHDSGYRRRRSQTYQTLNMLVDLGSSDMWAAVKGCKTSDCKRSSKLFDNSESLSPDNPVPLTLQYETGSAQGEVMWEQVTLGSFGIAYQAFLAANKINNEDLAGGKFQGLLGLALPANSVILDNIPGTTGSNPDGATFLDNLFGAGASAPSQRIFALSLERREDSRTLSSLGIGAVDERLCPLPCAPDFVPIVPHANLGRTGYLHWRVPLLGMKAYTFGNAAAGQAPTSQNITLGKSVSDPIQPHPMAVLDSGGVQILVGSKKYADAIYGAYGISAASDGKYRMPCTQPLSFSFNIGGNEFPVHPLDMSWPDPDDDSRQTCIGAIQVSNKLGSHGDIILGSTFLKNVYSVYKYPDQKGSGSSWQPAVGLVSLINQSTASADFYAVRNRHQSLTTVSGENGSVNPSHPVTGGASDSAQHRVVSTAIIAACSVVGFFVLAAAAFCAWWFWFRRKVGEHGVVEYKMAPQRPSNHHTTTSMSTLRSRKHEETQRQKSMVDGFSDYEIDSWRTDSVTLGNLVEVNEEDERKVAAAWCTGDTLSNHTRGSSLHQSLLAADQEPPSPLSDFYPRDRRGSLAEMRRLSDSHNRTLSVDRSDRDRPRSWDNRTTTVNSMPSRLSDNRRYSDRPEFPRTRSSSGAEKFAIASLGSNRLIDLQSSPPTSPMSSSYPNLPAVVASPRSSSVSMSTRTPSISMSGPFPTPTPMSGPFPSARLSSHRGSDVEEYFPALPPPSPGPAADRGRRASHSSAQSMSGPFPSARLSSHRGSDLDEYFPALPPSTPPAPDDRGRRPSHSSQLSRQLQ